MNIFGVQPSFLHCLDVTYAYWTEFQTQVVGMNKLLKRSFSKIDFIDFSKTAFLNSSRLPAISQAFLEFGEKCCKE